MQTGLPAPTAAGSLVRTPLPHLLVYALERRLTGSFELSLGAASSATVLVVGGCPAKVRTADPVHHLGVVLTELRMISAEQLEASLARKREDPRLQGEILLEMGALDRPALEAGLRSQVERKVEHLFGLPQDTTFAYYDGVDLLQRFGGAPSPIDPFPVLWRGVRQAPQWEHVDATLRRIGPAVLRLSPAAQLDRFAFTPHEREAAAMLARRPMQALDVINVVGPGVGQLLVYLLVIMKQVDLVDAHAAQPPPAAAGPPGARRLPPTNAGAPPSNSQAFARVQLQRQPRGPLVVEEQFTGASDSDGRTSSPGIASAFGAQPPPAGAFGAQPPPAGAFGPARVVTPDVPVSPVISAPVVSAPAAAGTPTDIASLISLTIQQSSIPPAMPVAPAVSVEAPPPSVPAVAADGAPSSGPISTRAAPSAALTPEQSALRTKILERAEQITTQDYFQMLGIERDAEPDAVQKAFFALAKVWHPDRLPPVLADVQDDCGKVFSYLTEAHATLVDAKKRQDYMTLLQEGGATPAAQAKIQSIVEAATEFQKAEFLLKRNLHDAQAYEIVKRCVALDPEQPDYLATLTWLDAQKPEKLSREKTLDQIAILDRCIQMRATCERAFFHRGMLYKRIDESAKALKDFKKAAELNPRNLDAMREVRLHKIRGGASRPPPGLGTPSRPPPAEVLGGLFGKLFKK